MPHFAAALQVRSIKTVLAVDFATSLAEAEGELMERLRKGKVTDNWLGPMRTWGERTSILRLKGPVQVPDPDKKGADEWEQDVDKKLLKAELLASKEDMNAWMKVI